MLASADADEIVLTVGFVKGKKDVTVVLGAVGVGPAGLIWDGTDGADRGDG